MGEHTQAKEFYEQSLRIAREIGDRVAESQALIGLGNIYILFVGEPATAKDYYQQALTLAREIDDRINEVDALIGLGNLDESSGEYTTAKDY